MEQRILRLCSTTVGIIGWFIILKSWRRNKIKNMETVVVTKKKKKYMLCESTKNIVSHSRASNFQHISGKLSRQVDTTAYPNTMIGRTTMNLDIAEKISKDPNRCPDCWMVRRHCFCSDIRLVDVTEVCDLWLYMHSKELIKSRASNTAKLLLRPHCKGVHHVICGLPDQEKKLIDCIHSTGPKSCFVLFPSTDATTLHEAIQMHTSNLDNSNVRAKSGRLMFIVLDGTWHTAKMLNKRLNKLLMKSERIVNLYRIKLTSTTRSDFGSTRKLYHGKKDKAVTHKVSTAGAVITLLEELKTPLQIIESLTNNLRFAIDAYRQQCPVKPHLIS